MMGRKGTFPAPKTNVKRGIRVSAAAAKKATQALVTPPVMTDAERAITAREALKAEKTETGDVEDFLDSVEGVEHPAPRPVCRGHEPGPFDPMGQTVYCNGACVQVKR